MRTIKVLAIIGLAVALVAVPALAEANAEAGAAAATQWVATECSVSTMNPPAQQIQFDFKAGQNQNSRVTCRAGGNPELATADATANNNVAGNVQILAVTAQVAVIGSEAKGNVTVQQQAPTTSLQKDSTVTLTLQAKDITREVNVEVRIVKRSSAPGTRDELLQAPVAGKATTKITSSGQSRIEIKLTDAVNPNEYGILLIVSATTTVPTLTEWGLIALAVLLAGGMGYMIYRRRPALRPAAP